MHVKKEEKEKRKNRKWAGETPKGLVDLAMRILDIGGQDRVLAMGSNLDAVTAAANEKDVEKDAEKNAGWVVLDRDNAAEFWSQEPQEKYTKVFANYPFGPKMRELKLEPAMEQILAGEFAGFGKTTSAEWAYNAQTCRLLGEKGKGVCIMSRGSAWNGNDKGVRQFFVENGLIEAVICLPIRLFSDTSIATSMIVLSRGNSKDVRIVDATQWFVKGRRVNELSEKEVERIMNGLRSDGPHSKVVAYDRLKDNDFILDMTRYLADDIKFQNGVPFGQVIKEIKRGAPLTASDLDQRVTAEPTDVQYLMLSQVQDGRIEEPLPYLENVESRFYKYCLKDGDLIMSRNNEPHKVGVATIVDGMNVIASGNMYVITLDQDQVDPYYLLAFFYSQAGILALRSISVGTVITNISIKDLRGLRIPLPGLDQQRRIADGFKEQLDQVRDLRQRLAVAEESLSVSSSLFCASNSAIDEAD